MAFIFMDESGDLGFDFSRVGTSNYFVIAFLCCENKRPVEKCVKKVHLGLRRRYGHIGVLHAYQEEPATRRRLLSGLAGRDCRAMAVILNKRKVYASLQDEKAVLYNYVTNILLDRIFTKKLLPGGGPYHVVASRKETNRFLNENFTAYLGRQLEKNHRVDVSIEVRTPAQEKGLQAADFVSWAVFRKYERADDSYAALIQKRIVEENWLYK